MKLNELWEFERAIASAQRVEVRPSRWVDRDIVIATNPRVHCAEVVEDFEEVCDSLPDCVVICHVDYEAEVRSCVEAIRSW